MGGLCNIMSCIDMTISSIRRYIFADGLHRLNRGLTVLSFGGFGISEMVVLMRVVVV